MKHETISHYRILDELGRGGMGVVYQAEDTKLGRRIALKFLPAEASRDEEAKQRFMAEARTVSALDHPNICTIHEIDESSEGRLFIAMACYEGETLKQRLRRGALGTDEAIDVAIQVAQGLRKAHEAGIVHRDIKPANIFLTRDGIVKILDFGVAKLTGLTGLTRTGMTLGTGAYMAPEQVRGAETDQRTDLWSLGVVMYEMLAGQLPFSGHEELALMFAALNESPRPLREAAPDVPEALEAVIARLLTKDPRGRYESAAQLVQTLKELQGYVSGTMRTQTTTGRAGAASERRATRFAVPVLAAGIGIAMAWFLLRDDDVRWLQAEAIPLIEMHLESGDFEAAYALAQRAHARVPDHPELLELWPRFSWRTTLESDPPGATVHRRGYASMQGEWEELGRTPMDVRVPFGLSLLRFELDGHLPLLRTLGGGVLVAAELQPQPRVPELFLGNFTTQPEVYKLDTPSSLPEGMVRVPGWSAQLDGENVEFAEFFLGRHEVTNAEFKAFVDAGGYRRPEWWDPIVIEGEVLGWEEAMSRFTDRTGRPGPGTWEAGDYPDGRENFPVTGVSWYEARAYARFRDAELPTAHHWRRALLPGELPWLLPISNLNGAGPHPVGESGALNFSGTFDMIGNVREWTASARGDHRFIFGGGWPDGQGIAGYGDTATASPLDRSASNGFRLAMTDDAPAIAARARAPIEPAPALPPEPQPVSDEVYAAYTRVFAYEAGPLNASIETEESTRLWIRQRITFDAAYGGERMVLYLYLPRTGSEPYQTVIYWPGSAAIDLDSIDDYSMYMDFIVRNGRAVAFPVYKGTFERGDRSPLPFPGSTPYRDHAIHGVNDLRRTIDYLETRQDIDREAIAFFGHSWGGLNGPVALAQEPRLSSAVLYVPFILPMAATPEVSPVHALPRVRVPTLVLSSEFDSTVPLANARRLYELLGTPAADKKHVIAPGGHFVPRDVLIRETLDWLDARFGNVGS